MENSKSVWGLTMAAYRVSLPATDMIFLTIMYIIGGTVTHSTACIINDICDRDFDAQVGMLLLLSIVAVVLTDPFAFLLIARTKTRPLVTGHVSVTGASIFLLCWTAILIALLSFTSGMA